MNTHIKLNALTKNILIVDDSQTNVSFLKSMLEHHGYTSIYPCYNAKEAYKKLNEVSIDLILLDVNMPDIDGLEACSTIKNSPKHKQIPIIMVTADDSDTNLQNSFDAGANDFVTKPVSFINLNTRMKNLFLLQEKDKLILNQTRSSAMSEIIKILAHQWRQPLAAISSTAINVQISKELDSLNDDDLSKNMNKINEYSLELSNTINEIRDITKQDILPKKSNINNLIEKAINFVQKSYSSKNIHIISEFNPVQDIKLYPNEFVRVLLNILLNSQEAFLSSHINSNKRTITIESTQTSKYTTVVISDNAGGISKNNINKVFDPYFSTKKEKNGTGLGLYNSMQIIKEHLGGELRVSSEGDTTKVSIGLLNNNPIFE